MPDVDWTEKGLKNAETLGEATSSTAQDIARGKPSEIDSLNGYVVRLGKDGCLSSEHDILDGLARSVLAR